MEGNPRFEATRDIPDVGYARFAQSLGLKGIFVNDHNGYRLHGSKPCQQSAPLYWK